MSGLCLGKVHPYKARQSHSCNTCLACMFSDGASVLEEIILDLDEAINSLGEVTFGYYWLVFQLLLKLWLLSTVYSA